MKKRSWMWFNIAIMFLAVGLTGFGLPDIKKTLPPSGGGFPGIGLIKLPDPVLNKLVSIAYEMKVRNWEKAKTLDTKSDLMDQVDEVFKDLQEAAERSKKYGEIAKKLKEKWVIHVIDSKDTINAFAWPGGKVIVYTPMLGIAWNKAGLAAVLGHEMIHALAGHGSDRLNDNLKRAGVVAAIMSNPNVTELDPKVKTAVLTGLGVGAKGMDLAFTRKNEFKADKEGLLLAATAGYDLVKAEAFWKRLLVESDSGFEYLNSHPNDSKRLKEIEQAVIDLKKLKLEIDPTKSGEDLKQIDKMLIKKQK